MDAKQVGEIVEELRGHIEERATTAAGELTPDSVSEALEGLGSPEELAREYLTDALLARAQISRSPLRILESLARWASLSIAGFFVLMGTVVGYFLGVAFLLAALLKFIHPKDAGLWTYPGAGGDSTFSLRLGFAGPPAGAQEMLGWWIVPLGLIVGCGLVFLTTRLTLWCVRRYRRSRALPSA